ncbi:hypothetical protein [Saliphagus sp. LR7]|uniref:hypothetical protein n=1 Tax=Saliphagus sp. LR7 TaxID=2282654 RepID=UPI000DF8434B|nr:hypothetical protein [Saliphagus sp. LR7]
MDVDELIGQPSSEVPSRDPTDENCNGKRTEKRDDCETVFVGYCKSWPGRGTDHVGEGRCKNHGGNAGAPEGNQNAVGNNGGAPEGNTNGEDHGAFKEFFRDTRTEDEQAAAEDVRKQLRDPEDAQEVAREIAADYLLKYRRSGDERFGRRFEAICDTFGITPADEVDVGLGGLEEMFMADLRRAHGEED